ncbi:hypothetical protein DVH07_18375 [Hafnia paralvei]|uniref:hypothetical protein n=1 Tax=Hafnia paralvei TaxID=546367 RepID=UPI000DF44B7D|nr:hypothetical protein [Hafnia paralvei]RDA61916.1 hypothetical protein DU449_17935 [Hafnia paralvei]RDA62977.1 hypothetical protein DVH08_20145 [Hafnia paralvei]RDA63817.1 hypothetical protein DVH09_18505 [Hafnia paralvei]RDA75103.1 hypothetical protein DVH10_17675 [Hafnia paralvei]RDA75507.1 hypothetical protein DVH07_18375 [Hafnia paralvei]
MKDIEVKIVKNRIIAAQRVMFFFKEKLNVSAANNPFRLHRAASEDILGGARLISNMQKNITHASIFDLTAKCRLGNCRELNSMTYMLLKSQHILNNQLEKHYVHIILTQFFDHAFVVICDKKFLPGTFNISYLGKTCVIVDRWTSDYYTPNLTTYEQLRNRLSNFPNPYQLYVRRKILSDRLTQSDKIPDM